MNGKDEKDYPDSRHEVTHIQLAKPSPELLARNLTASASQKAGWRKRRCGEAEDGWLNPVETDATPR